MPETVPFAEALGLGQSKSITCVDSGLSTPSSAVTKIAAFFGDAGSHEITNVHSVNDMSVIIIGPHGVQILSQSMRCMTCSLLFAVVIQSYMRFLIAYIVPPKCSTIEALPYQLSPAFKPYASVIELQEPDLATVGLS